MDGQPTEPRLTPLGEPRFPTRVGKDGRYELLHPIGRGGFGVVFAAHDSSYDCKVALKFLRRDEPDALYRFKSEFRSLTDIHHPNLVRLYELGVDDTFWFVVMDLVDGVDLLRYLRREDSPSDITSTQPRGTLVMSTRAEPRPADRDRLRHALVQIADGLSAIHGNGKLHRDLKPSNVLVTADERVVILDFGLVLHTHERPGLFAGQGIGTPGYMAPEQSGPATLTPAADWYAVGAMLHEALTGRLPHGGPSASLPTDDVGRLCRALLERDPTKRASSEDILRTLAGTAPLSLVSSPSRTAFVGRSAELRVLDDGLRDAADGPVVIRLVGVSGVGKTTLLDVWLNGVRRRSSPPVVLRGRCLEHENVPFKAIDGVIDALADYLAESERGGMAILRPAVRMFPVLAGLVPPNAESVEEPQEPHVLREQAITSLRDLLTQLGSERGLVICIDDSQWADVEGIRALTDLLDRHASGVLIVLLQRPDQELSVSLDDWLKERSIRVRSVELTELGDEDALSLAQTFVGEAVAARVARDAGGNPFLIHELAECHRAGELDDGPVEMGDLVARKLARFGRVARDVVEVIALAAMPLDQSVLVDAALLEGVEARGAIAAVEADRLVTTTRIAGRSVFTTPHDRVREEVVKQISPDRARSHHRRIAGALSSHGHDQPELLLHHHLGADDADAATSAAIRAAEQAEKVLAFQRAAEHYETVLRLGRAKEHESRFLEQRGSALANAGRAAEAAESLQKAAAALGTPSSEEDARARRALVRRSGELWLKSGHVDAGKTNLTECLEAFGISMPRSRASAVFDSGRRRLWLFARGLDFKARAESEVPARDLERLDAMWSVTTSLSMFDYLVADAIGLRHLLEVLRVGEKKRVLRSLAFEAALEAAIGGPFLEKRCERIVRRMEALAAEIDEPYYRAWALLSHGVNAYFGSSWAKAWENCREASTILKRDTRGSTWELAVSDVYGLSALTYLGDYATLERIVPDAHRLAREQGDLYATANFAFYESYVELAHDNPATAIELVERASEPFDKSKFLMIHFGLAFAVAQAHLYRGDPRAAMDLIEQDFPSWAASGMTRARYVRVQIRDLRARTAVALMDMSSDASKWRKQVAKDIDFIRREGTGVANAMADALAAAEAKLSGNRAEAGRLLESAMRGFVAGDMKLYACAAQRHLARLRGEEPTTTMPAIVSAERMSHLLVSGFRT
ncbi:MAG: protein kinase [Labilithrix sp.]|nr:protein kinase [Labilithrix sp.]